MSIAMQSDAQAAARGRAVRRAISRKRRSVLHGRIIGVSIAGLLVLGIVTYLQAQNRGADLPRVRQLNGTGPAALVSASAERKLGFVTVTGSVRNRSVRALRDVAVVVELLDSARHVVRVDTALVAFDPIRSGEDSPFRVDVLDAGSARAYCIRIQQLGGRELD